jgi:hypothetical protein
MKTSSIKSRFFSISGRLILWSVMLFCLVAQPVKAQDMKKFAFGPGIGIGVGFFNPDGVNEYINYTLSEYITTNANLYMYEEVKAFLNFKTRWFDVVPMVEYAIGPKIVVGADETFFFNRLSPGVTADFFIPMGMSGKYALFLGGGAQYHMMSFKGYTGETIGYRFQFGFDLQFGSFNLQPTLYFNLANAKNALNDDNVDHTFNNHDLDYTGGGISINMSFHKPVAH